MLLVVVWALSAFGTVFLSAEHSTYICPRADWEASSIHIFQCLGLLLDAGIVIILSKISKEVADSGIPWGLLSRLAFISAGVLGILAGLFLWKNPENISWSLRLDNKTVVGLVFTSLICTNLIGSMIYLISEVRPTTIVLIASFVAVYIYHYSVPTTDFSANPHGPLVVVCLIAFASVAGLVRVERDPSRSSSLKPNCSKALMGLFIFMTAIFFARKLVSYARPNNLSIHPITALISNARSTSDQWLAQAGMGKSLEQAVLGYQSRYGIPPPPRFDKWYEYATSRGSLFLDAFDQIHDDLLPFWGMDPAEIRQVTGHMLERPWTEVAGLRISNGTTAIGLHMPPTHRWMMEGAQDLINKFSEWLPDMDLAFNINDESRVTVPWMVMEDLKTRAAFNRHLLNGTRSLQPFRANRLGKWNRNFMELEPIYAADVPSEHFSAASFVSSFEKYGVLGCPPNSPARRHKWWNKKFFCHDCAAPHSLGPILANWTLSGSLCHQPDIANLHGFHLSPSAFKPTQRLLPIFSQSKMSTFSDILFPSPWNYRDKVIYNEARDMPFSEKEQTFFWRGATSEGYAIGGTWKGMQRQRFVHLANLTPNNTAINLLLPNHGLGTSYTKRRTLISSLISATNINVSFVGSPTRCLGPDCDLQMLEFDFAGPVDFQDHWKYKYLFDLDGAGFSGRFLPFLESRSLVFRAAGFRQWFDERLTAWRHFVPLMDDCMIFGIWWGILGERRKIGIGMR